MERKFRVLKEVYADGFYQSLYPMRFMFNVNHIISSFHYSGWHFIDESKASISETTINSLLQNNHIEEIIEADKKPISSEEKTNIDEDIYGKKYNIYEILTLIPNLPTNTIYKCSLDINEWMPTFSDKSLKLVKSSGRYIEEVYSLKEILEATYTIVKPVEEVKEKWVEILNPKDLCTAIANNKTIRGGTGAPINKYNSIKITTLFDTLKHGVIKIEYLEEN